MSSLSHHGIKGQKWGVRRYQNKDGTRTAAGKKQLKAQRLSRNEKGIRDVYRSLSDEDFRTLGYSKEEADQERKDDFLELGRRHTDNDQYNRVRYKDGKAVGYIAATGYQTTVGRGKKVVNILAVDLAVHSEYRGKGYSVALGKDLVRWFDTYGSKEYDRIEWYAMSENIGSQKAAERSGFTRRSSKEEAEGWVKYQYDKKQKLQHTSIGGTMYIEGNTLILGDSSYLEHHGIRGQRWGVRRFQNRDGSLTNAGRKRLGYATKGVTQTVGKAFKAGVKAGGKAVKAVKAHHEAAEAKKKEKKKEKASKTRLGVMANKDLFTNEEIRKLNERFKLEDEMKMATLQKGVEIAKSIGTIAQNVGTVAKTYEDVTGQSLSPIKRKAAEEKARQDKEDRERRIAREDADEARKAAKEERDIAIHEQALRKAIASADTQEFTAQKTKAEADSSILDLYKKGQDFNGGSDATGKSWVEKATAGGKNPFFEEKLKNDPELAAAKTAHDAKAEWKQHEQERDARIAAREKEAAAKQSPPQQKQGGGDDDALFSQKGSLPIDKDRYRNNRAMEKAKRVKEDAAEERAKKQDEKAAKATIDDMMEARRQFTNSARANSNGAFDRETAANYIKGKAKELPSKLNPINAISKKITDRALKEEEAASRKAMEDEYKKASRSQGRDEANYTMYYNRVNALQAQGYSERQAKKVADTENPFSSKRNRRFEYNEKVGEIETTHRKNAKEINKANKELTDYYYKLVNGPGYEPGSPKREALDRKYAQKRGELERLEKDNNEMLDREKKKAKKILEHSLSIQNGVLFVDSSDGLSHHGVKGQRWGVRRFQNAAGSAISAAVSSGLTHASYSASEAWEGRGTRMRSKKIAKYENMLKQSDEEEGMYHVENGTLFINAGEPYLEHHGVKDMKWGKHLMAGKGVDAEGGGGGGFAEDDEKLKEMAKKAGMSVAEFRTKMASKLSGAASKVGEAVYDAAGGSHKKDAAEYRKLSRDAFNEARKYEASGNADLAKAASARRKGNTSAHSSYKTTGDNAKDEARKARERASALSEGARQEQSKYEKSLAGKYDKMKADRARKKSARRDKVFSGTSPKAKKQINNARDNVEKAARANENAYKHAKAVYRQTGSDSDAYKQAIKRSGTTLQRYIDNKKLLEKKKRAKHLDETGAIYTEGTRLVVNSKWG